MTKKRPAPVVFLWNVFLVFVCASVGTLAPNVSHAETRGFVISYFHTATHADKRNCPRGDNGDTTVLIQRGLRAHGYSEKQIKQILAAGEASPLLVQDDGSRLTYDSLSNLRGIKDGKPVNALHYPESVPPISEFNTLEGPYAYGFDLDGQDPDASDDFEHPQTHEKGIDNQLIRAVGCAKGYDVSLPVRPSWEDQAWTIMAEHMPAWLFSITGQDLSRDGPATITVYRAVGHRRLNKKWGTLAHSTYIVDPSRENQGTIEGVIENGVFRTVSGNGHVKIQGEPNRYYFARMEFLNARLQLAFNQNGSAEGYLGGYQPWRDFWFFVTTFETEVTDAAALYQALQRLADGHPDPNTGENTTISAAYRIEAEPAFLARTDGTLITDAH